MIKDLEMHGFLIKEDYLDRTLIDRVRHVIDKDVADNGISKREMDWWKKAACWFPHLRDHPTVTALREALPEEWRQGVPCEPQILWAMPDSRPDPILYEGSDGPKEYWHVDQEPPWANGRTYRAIVGVPLTPFTYMNGGVRLWASMDPVEGERPITPFLTEGDIFVMHPKLRHGGGLNLTGGIRQAIYFRFLNDTA